MKIYRLILALAICAAIAINVGVYATHPAPKLAGISEEMQHEADFILKLHTEIIESGGYVYNSELPEA